MAFFKTRGVPGVYRIGINSEQVKGSQRWLSNSACQGTGARVIIGDRE